MRSRLPLIFNLPIYEAAEMLSKSTHLHQLRIEGESSQGEAASPSGLSGFGDLSWRLAMSPATEMLSPVSATAGSSLSSMKSSAGVTPAQLTELVGTTSLSSTWNYQGVASLSTLLIFTLCYSGGLSIG